MILALNIGNSNITFGSYTPDGKLVFSSRLFADTALSSDELLYKMVNMLALYGAELCYHTVQHGRGPVHDAAV